MLFIKNVPLLFGFALLFVGCNMRTTVMKPPVFIDASKVSAALRTLVQAENYRITGQEVTTNGQKVDEISISIINGKRIPVESNERELLGKSIATMVKSNLKNPNAYDKYKVSFVDLEQTGGLTSKNSTAYTFPSSML